MMNERLLQEKRALFNQYTAYISEERRQKLITYAHERTRYITVVLEDVYQPHNISAVLRTADCFGIQDIHIIEQKHKFTPAKEIVKGAAQWLSLNHYSEREGNGTEQCFKELRQRGYRLIATTPHENDVLIDELPLTAKTALIFGTEKEGLSRYAFEHADGFVKVPLYGFTESFNISVCAGIVLYELTTRLRRSNINWHISEAEILDIQLEWLINTTPFGNCIKKRLEELTSE